jgi:uncharacterized membrane protein
MLTNLGLYLRESVLAILSLGIVGAAAYNIIANGMTDGPLVNWAGIIVGGYFGAQVATRGEARRRESDLQKMRDNGT